MNIGILTFHSQTNYGGVLQAWALRESVRGLRPSDEVQVIDRWMDPENRVLLGERVGYRWCDWIKYAFRLLMMLGDWAPNRRRERTERFIRQNLNLTPYHFHQWSELADSGIRVLPEIVIVGSDQVWHTGKWGDPRPYLLEGAEKKVEKVGGESRWTAEGDSSKFEVRSSKSVPRVTHERNGKSNNQTILNQTISNRLIAYAASFGFTVADAEKMENATAIGGWDREVPLPKGDTLGAIYRRGLARFDAISCREKEGVEVAKFFGADGAVHVVDPTLLAPMEMWERFRPKARNRRPRLFVYLLGESVEKMLPQLDAFAAENGWDVEVFLDGAPNDLWYGPMPRNPRGLKAWWTAFRFRHRKGAKLRVDAGPEEFLRAIAAADGVVSDSFHALMFSIIFRRNIRILRPSTAGRKAMFARIAEFAEHAKGTVLADDLAAALKSVKEDPAPAFDENWLNERKQSSQDWLREQMG